LQGESSLPRGPARQSLPDAMGFIASARVRGRRRAVPPLRVHHAPHCGDRGYGGGAGDPRMPEALGSRAPARARDGWHPRPGARRGRLALRSDDRRRPAVVLHLLGRLGGSRITSLEHHPSPPGTSSPAALRSSGRRRQRTTPQPITATRSRPRTLKSPRHGAALHNAHTRASSQNPA
jgi:hypothetical protein